jgi:hypothetical protein
MAQQNVAESLARQNVKIFRAELRTEIDPVMRAHLHVMLLEEVKNLASSRERLAIIEHQIGELAEWIGHQQAVVDAEVVDRHGLSTLARALLGMLYDTMDLYDQYRRTIMVGVARRPFSMT